MIPQSNQTNRHRLNVMSQARNSADPTCPDSFPKFRMMLVGFRHLLLRPEESNESFVGHRLMTTAVMLLGTAAVEGFGIWAHRLTQVSIAGMSVRTPYRGD
jgi:hypothetical protein